MSLRGFVPFMPVYKRNPFFDLKKRGKRKEKKTVGAVNACQLSKQTC